MSFSEMSLLDHLQGYIGWKDINRHYMGANKALLQHKQLHHMEDIVGKTDDELLLCSVEENVQFQQQDLCVLSGEKVSAIHFDHQTKEVFLLEKSPLFDASYRIQGLIYYCCPYVKDETFQLLKQLDDSEGLHSPYYALKGRDNPYKLTPREYECVFLLIRGKSAKEIGALLALSKRTVESYIENIKNKMDCNNKTEVIVKALSHGYHHDIPERFNEASFMKLLLE